ncbi:uncharacterized protein LOC133193482 [Saccostrea echinata]|uniref:uncharacterized protein LOC133193482 n=1 Tax=Saccostrea echinata TaxID=191078 RepID=UPI002A83BA3D|nr:uncharacterized protein LOC133193482 [Saccostrea echinata]
MKIGICIKKLLIAFHTLLILESESKKISVRVTHEESFVVQGGGDQDVVEMVDPEMRIAIEKDLIYEELLYRASHNIDNNSHTNKDVLHHKSEGNPMIKKEREELLKMMDSNPQNGQFDIHDTVPGDSKSVLKTSDGYPEHKTSTVIYRGATETVIYRQRGATEKNGIPKDYRDKKLMDEIKSVLKENRMQRSRLKSNIIKNEDSNSHIINKNQKDLLNNLYNRTPFFGSNSNPIKKNVSDLLKKMQEIDRNDQRIEDQIVPSVDLSDEEQREGPQTSRPPREGPQIIRPPRVRRQIDINALADAHFETKNLSSSGGSRNHSDSIQVITNEDVDGLNKKAGERQADLLRYLGMTLLSVAGFSFICYCFIKDPKRCIALFGTGCPCCIVCMPCIKWYEKRIRAKIDVKAMMTENVNRYLPGCIIHDDGTIEAYEATQKEIDIAVEIIEIVNE